jgi:hypothetical protein
LSKLFGLGGAERTDVRSDAVLRGTDTVAGEFLSGIKSEDDTAIATLDFDRDAGADSDLFPHGAQRDQVQGAGPAHEPRGSEPEFRLVTHRRLSLRRLSIGHYRCRPPYPVKKWIRRYCRYSQFLQELTISSIVLDLLFPIGAPKWPRRSASCIAVAHHDKMFA